MGRHLSPFSGQGSRAWNAKAAMGAEPQYPQCVSLCGLSAVSAFHRRGRPDTGDGRVALLRRRPAQLPLLAARSDQAPTSTSSKSPGASRPTTSARAPSTSSKARRSWSTACVYTTAGTRRAVVALDAATGELNWVYSKHEGHARSDRAAPTLRPRPVLLDRRQRRRPHHLRHHRLPAGRAECEDRRADHDLRQERHGRPEGRRGLRQPASRSIW